MKPGWSKSLMILSKNAKSGIRQKTRQIIKNGTFYDHPLTPEWLLLEIDYQLMFAIPDWDVTSHWLLHSPLTICWFSDNSFDFYLTNADFAFLLRMIIELAQLYGDTREDKTAGTPQEDSVQPHRRSSTFPDLKNG
jgi:hypothetical protein